MNKIAAETELHFNYKRWLSYRHIHEVTAIQDSMTTSAALMAV